MLSSEWFRQLSGQSDEHILSQPLPKGILQPIHRDMAEAYLALQSDARSAGFDLQIASGFRSFERQCAIWNAKASGQRPILDSAGQALDFSQLQDIDKVYAIMRWSALPGTSRHHWGSDIDVYDAAAMTESYQLQLVPAEVDSGGIFFLFHQWLDEKIAKDQSYDFFRPYAEDRGGVAPEKWHLSYAPLAQKFQSCLVPEKLLSLLLEKELLLVDTVAENFIELYQRFVQVPAATYPAQYRTGLSDEY